MYKYYFDLVAIIIFIIVLFTTTYNKLYKIKSTRVLMAIACVGIFACIFEVLFATINLSDKIGLILTSCYVMFRNFMIILYLSYILISLRVGTRSIRKRLYILFAIPYAILLVCMVLNVFHPFIINVVDDKIKTKNFFFILFVLTIIYAIISIFVMIHHKESLKIKRLWFIIVDVIIICIAMLIQTLFSYWFVEMISISIALLLLLLTTERAEKLFDIQAECLRNICFKNDLEVDYYYHKVEPIVYFYFKAYNNLTQILSTAEINDLKKEITRYIEFVTKKTRIKINLYYANTGRYAAVVTKNEDNIREFVEFFNIYITNQLYFKYYNLKLDQNIVLTSHSDFSDLSSMLDFAFKFDKYLSFVDTTFIDYRTYESKEIVDLKASMPKKILDALKKDQFEVFYQPIYNIKNNTFETAEALVRLKEGDKYIAPDVFIPIAEEVGSIDQIGEFVYKSVCLFTKSKLFDDLGLKYIEVNVSPNQIINKNFAINFINIAKGLEIDPHRINFEITESASFMNYDIVNANIKDLKDFGFTFSLDDYGTGYSNMKRILEMPLQIIKIDKTIVDEIKKNNDMKHIIKNLVVAFHEVGFELLVEGIETKESLDFFVGLDCEFIQGFYYSKPLPMDDYIQFLKNKINQKSTN